MADFLAYFFGSAAYSLLGFVVGWLVGKEAKTIEEIKQAVLPEDHEEEHLMFDTPRPHRHRDSRMGKIGKIVLVLAAFTMLQSAYTTYQQRQVNECVAQYQSDLAATSDQRAQWADEDREALIDVFEVINDPAADRQDTAVALREALITYNRNSARRENNPLPVLENCD